MRHAGLVSLTLLQRPVFGLRHMRRRAPARAVYLGALSAERDPLAYGAAVRSLLAWHAQRRQERGGDGAGAGAPLIINTCGWIKVGGILPNHMLRYSQSQPAVPHAARAISCRLGACKTDHLARLRSAGPRILPALHVHRARALTCIGTAHSAGPGPGPAGRGAAGSVSAARGHAAGAQRAAQPAAGAFLGAARAALCAAAGAAAAHSAAACAGAARAGRCVPSPQHHPFSPAWSVRWVPFCNVVPLLPNFFAADGAVMQAVPSDRCCMCQRGWSEVWPLLQVPALQRRRWGA